MKAKEIADRKEIIAFFHSFMQSTSRQHILLIKGYGKVGKSHLLKRLVDIAAEHFQVWIVSVDLRSQAKTIPMMIQHIHAQLDRPQLTQTSENSDETFLQSLKKLDEKLLLLLFDHFDQANEEVQAYLLDNLLFTLCACRHIRIVIAGNSLQQISTEYKKLCKSYTLDAPIEIDTTELYLSEKPILQDPWGMGVGYALKEDGHHITAQAYRGYLTILWVENLVLPGPRALLTVNVAIVEGNAGGLVIHRTSQEDYFFEIGSAGNYKVSYFERKGRVAFLQAAQDWRDTPALRPGYLIQNTLKVVNNGSSLWFYANDVLLYTEPDVTHLSGKWGIFASPARQNTDVVFNDIHIYSWSWKS